MSKYKNSTIVKDGIVTQKVILANYTLDSSLVLLPGIVYNVTFSRFKAAALLSKFREHAQSLPMVKSIEHFHNVEQQIKLTGFRASDSTVPPLGEFDWMVLCVSPNVAKIVDSNGKAAPLLNVVTVTRIVGIIDDTSSIKITFQALTRAVKDPNFRAKKPNEILVSVLWNDYISNMNGHINSMKTLATGLFAQIDKFVDDYKKILANKGNTNDLLTLNPLANALFLQLAGSKDFAKAYTSLSKIVTSMSSSEINSPRAFLRVIDLTTAIVPFPNHEKLKMLRSVELQERASLINSLIEKMTTVFANIADSNLMMNHWFFNEASNMQKANVVANQLKSIRIVLEGLTSNVKAPSNQKQLVRRGGSSGAPSRKPRDEGPGAQDDDGDDDDLRAIADFIRNKLPEITSLSEDSKRLILKDFKRVKGGNPGNADFFVIRNYLEIVADMPWDKYVSKFKSNKDIDLAEARRQLDADHYGLEHVKERLIQYLVVLKLLGANADKEYTRLGLLEAKKQKELDAQKENMKFKRESTNGEAIIIPNNDESRSSKEKANEQIKHSSKMTDIEKEIEAKSLLVSKNNKSPIIMLAGPPGVGKTSLAKSIASVLGRSFQRVSLGGVKDESEIRGHRRTYVGAMPGTIVQALRKARSMNPVILLDEIDKIIGGNSSASKFNGDPAAALLEVLDPEQNTQFMDHYLGFPIDLSQVIFVCTANEPYNLSGPLLDRLEMIEIGAYDYNEKLVIGHKYLLPRHLVYIDDDVMKKVILDYTREAGVRNLERKLGTICRFKAVEYSESLADPKIAYQPKVEEFDLARFLGLPHPSMSSEIVDLPVLSSKYGVVNGLSYNGDGSGSVLVFESIGFSNDKGSSLQMTGRLGEVLLESGKIGLTFIKNTLAKHLLNLPNNDSLLEKLNNMEIHMHVPSGAVQKDGPSAGITMALLFLSLVLEKPVPLNIAMTGEITLRGLVLPIGGLKEKMLGAHLTGHIKKIIVPRENRRDIIEAYVHKINEPGKLNELLKDNARGADYTNTSPEDFFVEKYGVKVVYAKEFWDVIRNVWGNELLENVEQARLDEYHL
ncbi:CIC11C00000000797 [Sungouiella intermedia]|uniref:Lon protease homolog 2, peroxisomal n=1 Tax=Sungouiella intermedia TaxID=45354 RepID=A0A1L0BI10_9ASCO|nr:CIC11C00000000797 [[Candida] intermedia]